MAKTARKKTSPAKHRAELSAIPAAELAAELKRRERCAATLLRRHARLMEVAARLRKEIQAAGGSIAAAGSARAPGLRPRNKTSLVAALRNVLAVKTLSVSEAVKQVLESGYQSTSPEFARIVSQTLAKSDQFERVERGRYRARQQ